MEECLGLVTDMTNKNFVEKRSFYYHDVSL
jgi:hypothetical protein